MENLAIYKTLLRLLKQIPFLFCLYLLFFFLFDGRFGNAFVTPKTTVVSQTGQSCFLFILPSTIN